MKIQVYCLRRFPIRWACLLLLSFCFLPFRVSALQTITLAWDRSTEENIAGYKVYYGTSSRSYSSVLDVGNNTAFSIPNLLDDATYYFAVTAYDDFGIESDFSVEVSHASFKVQVVARSLNGAPTITWASTPLAIYRVLYKDDLNQPTWTVLSGLLTATGPSTSWVDGIAGSAPSRLYIIEKLSL